MEGQYEVDDGRGICMVYMYITLYINQVQVRKTKECYDSRLSLKLRIWWDKFWVLDEFKDLVNISAS